MKETHVMNEFADFKFKLKNLIYESLKIIVHSVKNWNVIYCITRGRTWSFQIRFECVYIPDVRYWMNHNYFDRLIYVDVYNVENELWCSWSEQIVMHIYVEKRLLCQAYWTLFKIVVHQPHFKKIPIFFIQIRKKILKK